MKLFFVLVLTTFLLANCGIPPKSSHQHRVHTVEDDNGTKCSVVEVEEGVILTCNGSTAMVRHGTNGVDGKDGETGATGEAGVNGQDGKDGLDGANGEDGKDGVDGKDGKDGLDGKTTKQKPIYVGYYCNRIVLKIGNTHYVNNSQLVPLTSKWYSIGSCKLRLKKGKIETK